MRILLILALVASSATTFAQSRPTNTKTQTRVNTGFTSGFKPVNPAEVRSSSPKAQADGLRSKTDPKASNTSATVGSAPVVGSPRLTTIISSVGLTNQIVVSDLTKLSSNAEVRSLIETLQAYDAKYAPHSPQLKALMASILKYLAADLHDSDKLPGSVHPLTTAIDEALHSTRYAPVLARVLDQATKCATSGGGTLQACSDKALGYYGLTAASFRRSCEMVN